MMFSKAVYSFQWTGWTAWKLSYTQWSLNLCGIIVVFTVIFISYYFSSRTPTRFPVIIWLFFMCGRRYWLLSASRSQRWRICVGWMSLTIDFSQPSKSLSSSLSDLFDNNVPFDNTTPICLINLLWKLGLGLDLQLHYFRIFRRE